MAKSIALAAAASRLSLASSRVQCGATIARSPIGSPISSVVCALLVARRGRETLRHPEMNQDVRFGADPRGSQALVPTAKARAALRGEAAAEIDEVRELAPASQAPRPGSRPAPPLFCSANQAPASSTDLAIPRP
jgi:hypothetical protein